jgi:hypothetical protein
MDPLCHPAAIAVYLKKAKPAARNAKSLSTASGQQPLANPSHYKHPRFRHLFHGKANAFPAQA